MFFARIFPTMAAVAHLIFAQEAPSPSTSSAKRPWYFNEFSVAFIQGALEVRRSGVPEAEASSVAKHIVDDGLRPQQYTEMASMAVHWVEREKVPLSSLSEVASIFASAYTSLHTQSSYSSLIDYVKQHTSIYDMELLFPPGNPGTSSKPANHAPRVVESIYSSIIEDPSGRAALKTFTDIISRYEHDFGLPVPQSQSLMNPFVGFIYNYVV